MTSNFNLDDYFQNLESSYFKCLLGGNTGDGKTTIALTFPGIYYIGFDVSASNAMLFYKKQGFRPDIQKWFDPTIFQEGDSYNEEYIYRSLCEKLHDALYNSDAETVIIDNLSSIYDKVYMLNAYNLLNDKKNAFSHWNNIIYEILLLFKGVDVAKKNVIIICHWEQSKAPDGSVQWFPKIDTKLKFDFGKAYPNCWNVKRDFQDDNRRKLQTRASSNFTILKSAEEQDDIIIPANPKEIYKVLKEHNLV